MPQKDSAFQELTDTDFDKIKALAERKSYRKDETIFSEGDTADNIYFIESGRVSILIQKFADQEEIATLGPGDYFGEMAFFSNDKRNASVVAVTDLSVLLVSKAAFFGLIKTERSLSVKINKTIARRQEEYLLREQLIDITGMAGKGLHVSIKGDPSLKETTFTRERYESVVDKILPLLEPRLEDLLLNRCIYQVYVGFNNGEIRTSSVFDPFGEEIHQAIKMADEAYVDRHFSKVSYTDKTSMLKRLYGTVAGDPVFRGLPPHFKKLWKRYYGNWKPISAADITNTLSRLGDLRSLPNYFLRNFTIGMTHDAIRMQFNCDGTHIVSAEDYQQFIDETV